MANGLNVEAIAKQFQDMVTDKVSNHIEAEIKQKASAAARRRRIIRSHGKTYTYGRYQNTGQLARNIKTSVKGKGKVVDAGSRANYSGTGYHGLYFLKEKQGVKDVKNVLNRSKKFVESLKL